ncbi:metalloprotease family protein [Kandleria vitulina]|uniref:metalloprotease family protein n=1 Tax=Kandleria vitulina TaxID=1630 RepID=UPI001F247661|nr:metalloprotease family protein [Kandleria vitulina]
MIIEIILSIILHEFFHYLTAKALKLEPKIKLKFLVPSVVYKNTKDNIKNLIVSSSPLLMILLTFIIPENKVIVFKIMCLCQLINIFPITADGEIILLSIMNLLKK